MVSASASLRLIPLASLSGRACERDELEAAQPTLRAEQRTLLWLVERAAGQDWKARGLVSNVFMIPDATAAVIKEEQGYWGLNVFALHQHLPGAPTERRKTVCSKLWSRRQLVPELSLGLPEPFPLASAHSQHDRRLAAGGSCKSGAP